MRQALAPGTSARLAPGEHAVLPNLVEIETSRAVNRERLLNDRQTAIKRKELADLLAKLDLAPIDRAFVDRAKSPFSVSVRALDAIHLATAEVLAGEADG